nr:PREDICTED: zinc finger matrin-type protein 1 isoform X1 [Anolis carolinensis]|eukprot:XP_008111317.1 PREDICTED: zinc finger matrin-type protein 1 isoform X1 [Anolis carolinensis]
MRGRATGTSCIRVPASPPWPLARSGRGLLCSAPLPQSWRRHLLLLLPFLRGGRGQRGEGTPLPPQGCHPPAAKEQGKKHAQKVRLYLQINAEQKEPSKQETLQMESNADKNSYCKLCRMVFSSPVVAQSHYLGKIHSKKLKLLSDQSLQSGQSTQPEPGPSVVPTLPEPSIEKTSQNGDTEDPSSSCATTLDMDDPERFCKLCSASFNNPLMARQHYVGKKHTRNEARKKLLAKMGTTAIPVEAKANAVGVGNYICPICSISLTSIEMYQSHMQGNKHQIKENMIANLMTNTKKTYDSFQDELADYIKVQKARGLEPKTNFRKPREEFGNEGFETINGHKKTFAFERDKFCRDTYEPDQHSIFFSDPSANSFEDQLLHWSPPGREPLKLENAPMPQGSSEKCSEKQVSHLAICRDYHYNLPPAESGDGYKLLSSDNSTSSYEKSQKLPKMSKEEKEQTGEGEGNPQQQKRKHSEDEPDLGNDVEKKKKKKDEVDSASEGKSKSSKEKGNKEDSSEKESKKHKKEKKKAEANGPTEEDMLWNESILGF